MTVEPLKNFVQLLAGAVQSLRLYPRNHPLIGRQVRACRTCLSDILARQKNLRLGVTDSTLFCDEYLFTTPNPALQELTQLLENLHVEGIEFQPGINTAELEEFIFLAHQGGWQATGLETALVRREIYHILPLEKNAGEKDPREIYQRALNVVSNVFDDVRLGRVPSSRQARETVRDMVASTLENPHALTALTLIKDYDNYTFHHSVNVAVISIAVGRACGLEDAQMRTLGLGGLLHDLGKLKIDVGIINKPGRLTLEEFEKIKKHPVHGAGIVEQMEGITREVIDIVIGHHLHYNRQGYPDDLAGRPLSPLTDMAAIADSYDAMTTMRSYRRPASPRQAMREMKATSGILLHPEYLAHFLKYLGPYPVGTVVRLSQGETALVTKADTEGRCELRLKILFNKEGVPPEKERFVELSAGESERIVGEVDPFLAGIDLGSLL